MFWSFGIDTWHPQKPSGCGWSDKHGAVFLRLKDKCSWGTNCSPFSEMKWIIVVQHMLAAIIEGSFCAGEWLLPWCWGIFFTPPNTGSKSQPIPSHFFSDEEVVGNCWKWGHFQSCLEDEPSVKQRMQVILEQREAQPLGPWTWKILEVGSNH